MLVITSNVGDNVVKSVENNVWATQRKNEPLLIDAFRSCRAVILIFSVSRSGAFQGYARMRSLPGHSRCKADPFSGFGRLFDVEWLRLQDVIMPEVSYLRNPLDEGRQVSSARDGQELPYEVGRELCTHFDVRVFLEDPDTYEPCMDEAPPMARDAVPVLPAVLPAPVVSVPAPGTLPGPPPPGPPPWMQFPAQPGLPISAAPPGAGLDQGGAAARAPSRQ
ncbi:unnamed protein product [Effrenium voratum]|uniref:YTH domain-containing protein n=1 Tax=Effrenium voratum TaxID=2562239 RepID=A0AA36MQM3_9DINO|nr:unnamed protein product [Effrenium voratum]